MNIPSTFQLMNTTMYSQAALALVAVTCVAWCVMVVSVLRGIRRHGAIEIPAAAAAANFAWATVWAWFYRTDLGSAFMGAHVLAFMLALVIFCFVYKNGARHVKLAEVRRYFTSGLSVSYVFWLWLLFLFVRQGNDTPTGILSGFMVSVFMSSLYVAIELADVDPAEYSAVAAWSKLVANGSAAAFCFIEYPANHFLLTLCVVTVMLDVMYLLLFRQRRLSVPSPAGP